MDNNYKTSNTLSSGVGLSTTAVRESEMTRVLTKLHQLIEEATKTFSDLDVRLNPILRGGIPETGGQDKAQGYSSLLAQDINSANEKIENLINYIQSVRSRVEL